MAADGWGRSTIIEKSREILAGYADRITVRQLHYRLVSIGMPNTTRHYKRVVKAMTAARWDGKVGMDAFLDRERDMYLRTNADKKDLDDEIEYGKNQVKAWMNNHRLERWSNQPLYVELWIEKKALQGVFERPCLRKRVGLAPCKGYPSITFLKEAADRFNEQLENDKEIVILYFGDHDPSGDNIPVSIGDNLRQLGIPHTLKRIALTPEQIEEMELPGVPPKKADSRTARWDGSSAVELDAIEPHQLAEMATEAIMKHFDKQLYRELKKVEEQERAQYQRALKKYVNELVDTGDE